MEFECMSSWPRTTSAGDYWEKTLPYVSRMATSHRYSRGSRAQPSSCVYNVAIFPYFIYGYLCLYKQCYGNDSQRHLQDPMKTKVDFFLHISPKAYVCQRGSAGGRARATSPMPTRL